MQPIIDTALVHHIGASMGVVFLVQILKLAKWFPWLDHSTDLANRISSIVLGVITSLGVTYTSTGDLTTGSTIAIAIPGLSIISDHLTHALFQMGVQEIFYKKVIK